jgi:hypothetical protein
MDTNYDYIRSIKAVNDTVMKPNASIRLILATFITLMGVLLIENIRNDVKASGGKGRNNRDATTVSNTEYIFFESLSRNLFFSLQ